MSTAALAYLGKTGPDYARFDLLSVISHLILAFLDTLQGKLDDRHDMSTGSLCNLKHFVGL